MEHQKTSFETVKSYEWEVVFNQEVKKGESQVELLSEEALGQ